MADAGRRNTSFFDAFNIFFESEQYELCDSKSRLGLGWVEVCI